MSSTNEFDVAIVGGGPGGYVAAIRAAQLGLSTAVIDKHTRLGGTCLNVGCIPSKALLDSSELFARVRDDGEEHGIVAEGLTVDLAAMQKRKDAVVDKFVSGVGTLMKKNGVSTFTGTGRLERREAGTAVVVTDAEGTESRLSAGSVVLATGSVPQELPSLPFDGDRVVSSTEALELAEVPKRLLIVGAGAIGLELGSVWSRLGAKVEVVEILPEILAGWDTETARTLRRELSKQGFTFHLGTQVNGARYSDNGSDNGEVVLEAQSSDGEPRELTGDKVLVAVGRKPFTDGSALGDAGIEMEADGKRIKIDDRYRTNVPGVYAIGDVVPGPMLAHKAEDEGVAVAEIIAGGPGEVNYETIPNVVYTWPEVAATGRTEDALKQAGTPYRKGRFPFAANGRAVGMGAPAGFAKILADEGSDRILGASIIGPYASDLISEIVAVMEFDGSAEDIARTMHAHPTLPEAVREAALSVAGRSIHGA
ncbi:MAG: dihydrolipoyl dehydrogenase [Spirochaetaceae bacterium]